MAKKKKITRKELLKKEDEFISFSNRVSLYVSTHAKQIEYLGLSLVIIIVLVIGISLYFRHLNKKALIAYNLAYKNLVSDFSPDIKKDNIQRSIEELDNIIKKYGWTKMAILAIPQLAYLKFGQGKYDEAIPLYQTYLKRDKSDSIYRSMCLFGLAATYEAKGDHQSAISHLKKIVDGEDNFLKEEAMFSLFKESPLLPLAKANLRK
jgi:tetratricopeptide (TPR) repeat protein